MTTGRSPNYPSVPLTEALDRLKALYDGIHTRPAERELIAQNLGYKGLNGRSLGLIATLTRYGLLVKEGKGLLRVSDRAVSILELSKGEPERAEAVKSAAFEPSLFSQMYGDFGENVPKAETLKHYLIKKGFLPAAAGEIIRVYQENLALVNEEKGAYDAPMSTRSESIPTNIGITGRETVQRAFLTKTAADLAMLGVIQIPEGSKVLKLNVSRDVEAQIIFSGPVTQEAIDKLSKLLELQKDTFPTQEELQVIEDYASGKVDPLDSLTLEG